MILIKPLYYNDMRWLATFHELSVTMHVGYAMVDQTGELQIRKNVVRFVAHPADNVAFGRTVW